MSVLNRKRCRELSQLFSGAAELLKYTGEEKRGWSSWKDKNVFDIPTLIFSCKYSWLSCILNQTELFLISVLQIFQRNILHLRNVALDQQNHVS